MQSAKFEMRSNFLSSDNHLASRLLNQCQTFIATFMPFPNISDFAASTFSTLRGVFQPTDNNSGASHGAASPFCDRVRQIAEGLSKRASEVEASFSKMLVDCFLPAEHDITPAWMFDDYGSNNRSACRPEEFDEFAIPESMGAATDSTEANTVAEPAGARQDNPTLASAFVSGIESFVTWASTPSSTHEAASNPPGTQPPAAGIVSNEAPATGVHTDTTSTPTSPSPIGSFYNPYGEDNESLAWKPIVDQTVQKLQTGLIPQTTPEHSSTPDLVNTLSLQQDKRTMVFDSFQKIDHEGLIMVLSNVELMEKFKTELGKHLNITARSGNPALQDDQTTRLRNEMTKRLPNGKAALELQQHVVKVINTQIKDHCAPDSLYQNFALNFRNTIKGNIQLSLNANFVRLLTGRGGIEKVNESLKQALVGYAPDLSE